MMESINFWVFVGFVLISFIRVRCAQNFLRFAFFADPLNLFLVYFTLHTCIVLR